MNTAAERRLGVVAAALAAWWMGAAAVWFWPEFMDDAFIGLRYVRHLADHGAFVFNLGQPAVEGVTNTGWLLVLVPLALAVPATLAAKLAGIASVAAVLVLLLALGLRFAAERPGERWAIAAAPALLLAAGFEFPYFSLAGMETAFLAALFLAMAALASRTAPPWRTLGLLGAAAFLVHPEAALVLPLFLALRALAHDKAGDLARAALAFALAVAAIEAARLAYFGDWVPNTVRSKPTEAGLWLYNAWGLLEARLELVPLPLAGIVPLALAAFGWRALRRPGDGRAADLLAATVATGIAFAIYAPTDWTRTARYFAPYLPAALLLFWGGLAAAAARIAPTRPVAARGALALLLLAMLAGVALDALMKRGRSGEYPGYVIFAADLVAPSRWMAANLPPRATVATRRIGAIGYWSELDVFDYSFGLTEREVARRVAGAKAQFAAAEDAALGETWRARRRQFGDPNDPGLAELWRARRPTHLLEDFGTIAAIAAAAGGTPEEFTLQGDRFRVVRRFRIGNAAEWQLAARVDQPPLP